MFADNADAAKFAICLQYYKLQFLTTVVKRMETPRNSDDRCIPAAVARETLLC